MIDVELPGEDGFSVASHLRSASDVGIVFATARGTLDDRVRGMRGGADAYLVKPVHPEELAATLEAVHRRMGLADASAPDKAPQAAPAGTGHWALTEGNWLLCDPEGQHIRLTTSERAVTTLLFEQEPARGPRAPRFGTGRRVGACPASSAWTPSSAGCGARRWPRAFRCRCTRSGERATSSRAERAPKSRARIMTSPFSRIRETFRC